MSFKKYPAMITLTICFTLLINVLVFGQSEPDRITTEGEKSFRWPEGKRAAISLGFDDARLSQIDCGIPILDKYGVKATFYVTPSNVKKRLAGWKMAVANGHEIGNHTLTHPCTINYGFVRKNALEDYTLEMMEHELDEANDAIERLLGVRPTTFAYPCGQKFVGRGEGVKSYVPLVAKRFIVGRGWLSEAANNPASCDLAQVMGIECDGLEFEQIRRLVDQAVAEGRWLVLCGHEIGEPGRQTTPASALEDFCKYAQNPASELWVGTVQEIGRYILEQRASSEKMEKHIYLDPDQPIDRRVEDLLGRMTLEEKIGQMNMPVLGRRLIGSSWEKILRTEHTGYSIKDLQGIFDGCRRLAEGIYVDEPEYNGIGPGGGFFALLNDILDKGTRQQAEFLNELQKIALFGFNGSSLRF